VLFWGILGAMILRAIFIFAGVALIEKFKWTMYIFGAFLVLTGIKMALAKGTEVHPERNPILRLLRRVVPLTKDYIGGAFFARGDGGIVDEATAQPAFRRAPNTSSGDSE
jgi:tellurite resistance protein TerC